MHRSLIIRRLKSTASHIKPYRPVGVGEVPRASEEWTENSVFSQVKEELLNPIARKQARQQMMAELKKSSFHETYAFREHKGKTWIAPPWPLKAEKSLYMPNYRGYTLEDTSNIIGSTKLLTGKTSIVRLYTSLSGQMQVDEYLKGSEANAEDVQIVDINIPDHSSKSFLLYWFGLRKLKKSIEKSRYGTYMIVPKNGLSKPQRLAMRQETLYAGYVYVVDEECRIRWAACGDPDPEEIKAMWRSVRSVNKERRKET
ncbi:hypothetical protein CANCADRAFT_113191 [Tortispora caseinolytica NRRL Y-17796]|uniref:Mitochondrial ATPase complex subunit ATP10 n=1 Tax=Tortispora caseinolytica NRRL Y-17796 TaxID=767744 RepID=A0A1E4TGQ1_9ASCO|nr:hypothetical protein CANCADRAFT_113191 [Tortispora caseinolytica NRRL Y-17796]